MALNFIDVTSRSFRTRCDITSKEFVAFLDLAKALSDQHYDAMKVIDVLGKDALSRRAYKTKNDVRKRRTIC